MNHPTLPELARELRDETSALIRDEVALAKTELSEKASLAGRNLGFIVGGALVGYSGLVLVLLSLGWLIARAFISAGMAEAMAVFLGLLIVGVLILALSAALVMKGVATLKSQSLRPEKTIDSLRRDRDWGKEKVEDVRGDHPTEPAHPASHA
ncbi:hypothetical protein BH23VER1_BH23VER1_34040 [soil metagenome]